jgi:hypothetical protein
MFEDSLVESSGHDENEEGYDGIYIGRSSHHPYRCFDFDPIDLYGHDRGPSARYVPGGSPPPHHRPRRRRKMWLRHLWSSSKFRSIGNDRRANEIPKEIAHCGGSPAE